MRSGRLTPASELDPAGACLRPSVRERLDSARGPPPSDVQVMLYLDNAATTAVAPEVVEAMLPFLAESHGNPSSLHGLGVRAADAVESARASVARLLGARSPDEVLFTSGGTESIHTAIGAALARAPGRPRVVTSRVEHSAVLGPLERLAERGRIELVRAGVDARGRLDVEGVVAAIDERCALVTLQAVNNETGVVTPEGDLRVVGERCRERGALLHVDAVQAAGKLPLRAAGLPLDLVSIAAHKLHGPKGAGALWIRSGLELEPLLPGGPQESGRRAGTENVPALVGAGRAAELALARLDDADALARTAELRDRLEEALADRVPRSRVVARDAPRVASISCLVVEGISGEALVVLLGERGLAASSGSACSSGRRGPSHVLTALGLPDELARGALRLSLSRHTTADEVDAAVELVAGGVEHLRAIAPD